MLSPQLLLSAYSQGVFPMADETGKILWFDPDPRAIIPLHRFHVSRSLQRLLRKGKYEVRWNSDFSQVIRACAQPGPGREDTWISDDIIEAYERLHQLGFAHSVESWHDGVLVGGLYGVAIGGLFAGESMFSHMRDASKVTMVHLVKRMQKRGLLLLDIQFMTDHLSNFGAIEIPRCDYHKILKIALNTTVTL
jgi:leucyl/phenylalanyl-tRNA--protein transferase